MCRSATKTMKSVSGRSKDGKIACDTESANQARFAEEAMARPVRWELSNPAERSDKSCAHGTD